MQTTTQQNDNPHEEVFPLRARRDMVCQEMMFEGQPWVIVKDPVALEYYRFRAEHYRLLELLDGTRSLDAIRRQLNQEFPTSPLSLRDIQAVLSDFGQKGLIVSSRQGGSHAVLRTHSRRRWKQVLSTVLNPFFIRLPGWDPQQCLSRLYPVGRLMFRPWAFIACSLFIVASWLYLAVCFEQLRQEMPGFSAFFSWPNIGLLWLTLGMAKVIHELAHGLACRHYGGECHEIGIAFLVLSPCLYCDVSDSWLLPDKHKRIIIAAAGIYIEVLMSAVALFLWQFTLPGMLHYLLLNLFLVTTFTTVIFNANPLLKYDGYYILADWLEIPNLRSKADSELRRTLVRICTGIQPPETAYMPTQNRHWFLVYAVSAAVYRCVLVVVVGLFLYHLLQPIGLQSLAVTITVASVAVGFFRFGQGIVRTVSEAGRESVSRIRLFATAVVVAGLIVAGATIPLPLHGYAPLFVEPLDSRDVFSNVDGRIVEILAESGSVVTAGQPILILESESLEDDYTAALSEYRQRQLQSAFYRAAGDSVGLRLALDTEKTSRDELSRIQTQIQQLTIYAPCSGTVVTATENGAASASGDRRQQPSGGSPMDSRNHGAWLPAGAAVCSIVPDSSRWQAVLYVDQADRNQLQQNSEIEINLAHCPGRIMRGRVQQLGSREEETAPASLSTFTGGTLSTVADGSRGGQRLASATYRATATIDWSSSSLAAGMRGQARFRTSHRTLAALCSNWVRRTFSFEM